MNRRPLRFFVPGAPVPQGSKVASCRGGRASMRESAKGHAGARKRVRDAAILAAKADPDWVTIDKPCPVFVQVEFVYLTPASRKTPWGTWRTVMPDSDKLFRLIGDALKDAKVYGDDCQIAAHLIVKHEMTLAEAAAAGVQFGTYVTTGTLRGTVDEFKTKHGWI